MGSKNKISLGVITALILHNIRNIFDKKDLYITKNKYKKIVKKHPDITKYLNNNNFQVIVDNTFASCEYDVYGLYNFISKVDNRYIIYSISINNYFTEISTVFYASKRVLRKCSNSIKFLNKKIESDFLKDIN